MEFLNTETVMFLHDSIINPNELQGEAANKSVDSVMARVKNHLSYDLIEDVYHLAAFTASCIAIAHAFNDANKRTAFACMDATLDLNGISIDFDTEEAGDMIRKIVTGDIDEYELASWLRSLD